MDCDPGRKPSCGDFGSMNGLGDEREVQLVFVRVEATSEYGGDLFRAAAAKMGDEQEQTRFRIKLRRGGHSKIRASIGASTGFIRSNQYFGAVAPYLSKCAEWHLES